jgi:hypothetical protein
MSIMTDWTAKGRRTLRGVLVGIAFAVLLLAVGEAIVRLGFDRGGVLSPTMVRDRQFGAVVALNTPGHDRWGFRNVVVPAHAEVVALGDSMTYGAYAAPDEAWPRVLAREANVTVYNAAISGWGPSQFLCAMKVYGRPLRPKFVIIGLYVRDDVRRAATANYPCLELDPERVAAGREIIEDDDNVPFGRVRRWLNHHSALYQTVKLALSTSSLFPRIAFGQQNIEWTQVAGHAAPVRIESNDERQRDYPLRTGVDNTVSILASITDECARIDAKCYLVFIPSRESLFYELLDEPKVESVVKSLKIDWTIEHDAIEEISRRLTDSRLTLLDATADLRDALKSGMQLFPIGGDPHFNANGYRVIGSYVARRLRGGA